MSKRITPISAQPCTVVGCGNLIQAKGLCHTHYVAAWRAKAHGPRVHKRRVNSGTCSSTACGKPAKARGFCRKHYEADCKTNPAVKRMGVRVSNIGEMCSHNGCHQPARTKLLCELHYGRLLTGKPLDDPRTTVNLGKKCLVESCHSGAATKGFCRRHYQRQRSAVLIDAPWRTKYSSDARCDFDGCGKKPTGNGYCKTHDQTVRLYGKEAFSHIYRFIKSGCDICGSKIQASQAGKVLWRVDHNHSCCKGKKTRGDCIRGVLCHQCNVALGLFKDSPEVLEAALSYLIRGMGALQRREA